ncbi:uncharacterized protein LOC122007570 [Zingiber officinale]|uniref:uncharacterized protein LOC122007570 n=1 Tax=Zingiber officinale TaxID=94328 RepID=UPI001C4CB6CC|nr:uncharacterized protein LOC122007570 [Zingiber officinale]
MENKKKMLDVIKEKYDLPPGTESWTLRSISKKWRNWKSELKKKYYDPELPMQVLLEERDNRALVEQYVKLVIQWNSEKSKGKERGRPPSRVELFHACFTHANGSPSSNIVAEKLAAMKELENQLPEDEDDQVGQNDIFAQIIGPDRPGRVRMFGDGVNPSDLWGEVPSRSTCNRIVMEQRTKLEKMDKQVGCSVSIKSLFDSMKIVAKGVVHSMDPNTEVGRQALGPNWCEIQVLVVLEREESLIRPYDLLQRFEDTLGGMIAWPCHLLTVNEEDFY